MSDQGWKIKTIFYLFYCRICRDKHGIKLENYIILPDLLKRLFLPKSVMRYNTKQSNAYIKSVI